MRVLNIRSVSVVFLATCSSLAGAQDSTTITRTDAAVTDYVDAGGRPTSVVTDAFGQSLTKIDPAGLQTTIVRDNRGNALQTMRPSGELIDRSFDRNGNVLSYTDQNLGGTITFEYDSQFSRPIRISDAQGADTLVEYDSGGQLARTVTPLGREFRFDHSTSGLVSTTINTLGAVTTVTYDSNELALGASVVTSSGTRSAQISRTASGFVDTFTDPMGRVTALEYDIMGRIIQTTLPGGRLIAYEYDSTGNQTSVTLPAGSTYGYSYNEIGQMVSEQHPAVAGGGSNQTTFSYNPNRQLAQVISAGGTEVTFAYDVAGRLQTVSQPNGDYSFRYGATSGLIDSIDSPFGVTQTQSYTGARLAQVSWSGAVTGNVGYSYDSSGRLAVLSVVGVDYSYLYSLDSELVRAGQQTLTYDATTGLLTGLSLDATSESLQYGGFGELVRQTVNVGAAILYDAQYLYDDLGRVTQITETIEGTATIRDYSYDLAGRLDTVNTDNVLTATYLYDANDNRIDNGASYDEQDRILARSGTTFIHNAQGELISKSEVSGDTQYNFDAQGNLISATLADNTQIGYVLDGLSRRVAKLVNGTTTEGWLYGDELNPVASIGSNNAVLQRFIYASQNHVPDYFDTGSARYKLITDHLGSVRLVVDASDGSVVQQIDYDAWGDIVNDTNPGFQPFAYAGGLYDIDTSLTNFGFREYDAESARWLSKDPLAFIGSPTNLYAYVTADPINQIDPQGLESGGDSVWTQISVRKGKAHRRREGEGHFLPAFGMQVLESRNDVFSTGPDSVVKFFTGDKHYIIPPGQTLTVGQALDLCERGRFGLDLATQEELREKAYQAGRPPWHIRLRRFLRGERSYRVRSTGRPGSPQG